MAVKVKSIVLSGLGTNCEMEMAHACRLAGSEVVDIVHISSLLTGEVKLDDYHFLNLPGGFLDGDDLGSAKAGAHRLRYACVREAAGGGKERLLDQFLRFVEAGKLILGVCNGFQLLVKMGFLPALNQDFLTQQVTLTYNDSGRFEDRWVYLKVNEKSPCVFTSNLKGLYLPVRHGEGKFLPASPEVLTALHQRELIVCRYSDSGYEKPTSAYPANPNGSVEAIAAITNETGRIFGLMPHPEAYLHYTNHPRWTRERLPVEGMGQKLFRNAVSFIKKCW
jgi:phosphoribosylformylglycinamidine synthase